MDPRRALPEGQARSLSPGRPWYDGARPPPVGIPEMPGSVEWGAYGGSHPREGVQMRLEVEVPERCMQEGRLSMGSACELAGLDRYAFMAACRRYRIPVVDYAPDDLADELRRHKAV